MSINIPEYSNNIESFDITERGEEVDTSQVERTSSRLLEINRAEITQDLKELGEMIEEINSSNIDEVLDSIQDILSTKFGDKFEDLLALINSEKIDVDVLKVLLFSGNAEVICALLQRSVIGNYIYNNDVSRYFAYSIIRNVALYRSVLDYLGIIWPEGAELWYRSPSIDMITNNIDVSLGGVLFFGRFNNVLSDPALIYYSSIEDTLLNDLLQLGENSESELISWKILVSRNLYFANLEPTSQNIADEIQRILSFRQENFDVPLFQDRRVVFFAQSERWSREYLDLVGSNEDPYFRFGRESTVSRIQEQTDYPVEFFRQDDSVESGNLEDLANQKNVLLSSIINTAPPMTFVFDGHGAPFGLFLADGDIENITNISDIPSELYISVDEMVNTLVERYTRFPGLLNSDLLGRDIFILASCYSVSYFRDVYSRLENLGYISLPILISPTEYSSVASSNFSDYGSDFFNTTLGLGIHSGVSTFGDVFNAIDSQRSTKPSLYVPTSNELRQIVEVETIDDGSSSV